MGREGEKGGPSMSGSVPEQGGGGAGEGRERGAGGHPTSLQHSCSVQAHKSTRLPRAHAHTQAHTYAYAYGARGHAKGASPPPHIHTQML